MRKILFILTLLVCGFISQAQNPIPSDSVFVPKQALGNAPTTIVQTNVMQAKKGFINGVFADTTQANTYSSATGGNKLKYYPGAQIFTTSDNSFWVRNSTATKWLKPEAGTIDIDFFDFFNDTTGIICFSNGSCDTFAIVNLFNTVTNIVQNFLDSSVTLFNDSTLIICRGEGAARVCDTIHLGNSNTYYFLNDSTLVSCDTVIVTCVGDSCYQTQLCDTTIIPGQTPIPGTFSQNWLRKIPGTQITEFGSADPGDLTPQMIHDTWVWTNGYQWNITGRSLGRPITTQQQSQWSLVSSSITQFNHQGNYVDFNPSAIDNLNPVNLYINYIDPILPGQGVFAGDTIGFMGAGKFGYALMTNSQGDRAAYTINDVTAKQVGIYFDTYSSDSVAVSIFGNQTPKNYAFSVSPFPTTSLSDARIAVFKTTGQVQLPQYTTGAFPGTATYLIAQDAIGNLIQYPAGGLSGGVFFARDDAANTGSVDMYFDVNNKAFQIDDIGTMEFDATNFNVNNRIGGLSRISSNATNTQILSPNNDAYITLDNSQVYIQATDSLVINALSTGSATDDVLVMRSSVGSKRIALVPASTFTTTITADNGLTKSTATNVQLGGDVGSPSALLNNRYIATGAFTLNLSTSTPGVTPLYVLSGSGIAGSFTGTGAGAGIYAESGGGRAVEALSFTGVGGAFLVNPSSTNTVVPVIELYRHTSGAAANGIGGSIDFITEADDFLTYTTNSISSKLTVAANATRTSQLDITGVNSASTGTIASFYGSGVVGIGISSGYQATRLNIVDNTFAGASAVKLFSTSTAAPAANSHRMFEISITGTNATASATTFGEYSSNTHDGTGSVNYGIFGTASGGASSNYGVAGETSEANGFGVYGSNSSTGYGVYGFNNNGAGVGTYGYSETGKGVQGQAFGSGYAGYFENIASTGTLKALYAEVSGAATTNIAAQFQATNATNNYALIVPASSGSIGFGTSTPSNQALLELASTTQAFIVMRMTAAQATAITPAIGMILYTTDTDATFTSIGFWVYEAGAWRKM